MVKYCDRCKFNTTQDSKAIPDEETESTLKKCPICGDELYIADSFEDIP